MKTMRYMLQLTRPLISTTAGLTAICAAIGTGLPIIPARLLSVFGVVWFTSAFGFALNDFFDYEKDKIAHPERVLSRGLVERRHARSLALCFGVAGLACSLYLPIGAVIIDVITLTLLGFYSYVKNRHGVLANSITATNVALVCVFGMVGAGRFNWWTVCVSVAAFWIILGREIVLDIRDVVADRITGKSSLAIVWAETPALWTAGVALLVGTSILASASIVYCESTVALVAGVLASGLLWVSFLAYVARRDVVRLRHFHIATQAAFLCFAVGLAAPAFGV